PACEGAQNPPTLFAINRAVRTIGLARSESQQLRNDIRPRHAISCRPQKAGIGRVVGVASLPSTLGVAAAAMFGTGKSVVRIITYSGQNCGERGTMQFLSPSLVDRCDPQEIAVCAVVNRATNDNYLGLITRLIQSGSAGTLRATSRATACFESFGFFFQISSAIFCH